MIVYIATVDSKLTMEDYSTSHAGRADCIYEYSSGKPQQLPNRFHNSKNMKETPRK